MQLFDRFPARYLAPNLITCTSLSLGLLSIRTALTATQPHDLHRAAWMILYTVLLDKADGAVARKFKASSAIGVQLDSLSDFVTFGIAPAALVSSLLPVSLPGIFSGTIAHTVCLLICAVYAVATGIRLARFNVTTTVNDPRFFLGLPSTASGGLIAAAVLAHNEMGLPISTLSGFLGVLALNALLMLSNLPIPKLGLPKNMVGKVFVLCAVASAYVLIPLNRAPTYLLFVASSLVFFGFAYGLKTFGKTPAPSHE